MRARYFSTDSAWIVAHRGGLLEAPENTLAAFDAALRYPIDGIEFDVQMTSDGILVLHHDTTIRRISGRNQRISNLPYATLAALDWGSWFDASHAAQRIVTLASALERYTRRTRLMVEVKTFPSDKRDGRYRDITAAVLRALHESVPAERVAHTFVLSFDSDVLEAFHALDARWPCVLNTVTPDRIPDGPEGRFGFLTAYCAPIGRLTPDIASRVRDRGKRLMTWACNTPRQVEKAWRVGCDVVMSDRPSWIAEFAAQRRTSG